MAQRTTIGQRLKELMDHYGLNQTEFSERSGIQKGNLSSILNGKRTFGEAMANKVVFSFENLNRAWLLTGEGSMLVTPESSATEVVKLPNQEVKGVEADVPVSYVPLLPIAAQAGSLNDFVTSVSLYECEMVASPMRDAELAVPVTGDSMSPEYPSGSRVLVKKINERAFIDWGRVYVLDTTNGYVVKKLMPAKASDRVLCVSINPEYPPFEVAFEYIKGVYRVLMCMAMK